VAPVFSIVAGLLSLIFTHPHAQLAAVCSIQETEPKGRARLTHVQSVSVKRW